MKKIILVITLFAVIIGIGSIDSVSANSTYLINNNNIEISIKDYEQLKIFGLSDEEINEISYDDFIDFTSKNIKYNYKEEKHIETTYYHENGEIVNQVDIEISLDEMNKKVDEKLKENLDSEVGINELPIVQSNSIFLVIDDGDGVGDSTDIIKTKYESTTYKTFYLYGVYYADEGNYGEFYIRTTLDWKITPSNRYVDILTLGWNDNVQIKEKYFPSSGQEYPDIYSYFTYDMHYSSSYIPLTTTNEIVEIFGNEPSDYMYDLSDKEVGIEYDLPANQTGGGGGYYFSKTYDNFSFKMEVRLTVTDSSMNGVTFGNSYQHQIGAGAIDWGEISISPTPPYFSYHTDFFEDDPSFDAGIGGFIIFSDIG